MTISTTSPYLGKSPLAILFPELPLLTPMVMPAGRALAPSASRCAIGIPFAGHLRLCVASIFMRNIQIMCTSTVSSSLLCYCSLPHYSSDSKIHDSSHNFLRSPCTSVGLTTCLPKLGPTRSLPLLFEANGSLVSSDNYLLAPMPVLSPILLQENTMLRPILSLAP
jgi:hypothetical protein